MTACILPPSAGNKTEYSEDISLITLVTSNYQPDCTVLNVQLPNCLFTEKHNGSRYFVPAVTAVGFDTEAVRCNFLSVR
jgi:hypothetical protein